MSHYKYKYILAIAELKSFSKAADALFVSQPYLSKVVSAMEAELGCRLFDRTHNPLTVTEAGSCYIEYIREVLAAEERMRVKISALEKTPSKQLTLGMGTPRIPYILPPLLERLALGHPEIKLSVIGQDSNTALVKGVENGSLDLAFFTSPKIPPSVSHVFLNVERLLLILPSAEGLSPACAESKILGKEDLEILKNFRFIVLTEAHGLGVHARKMLETYRITPKSLYEVPDLETAHRLAATGFGATIIPDTWRNRIKFPVEPVYYQIGSPPLTRDVVMIYRKGRSLSPAEKTVCELAMEINRSAAEK